MEHTSGVITFPNTMTLATDLTGARIVLWPGIGNEWYGFGMNNSTLNYNVPSGATHKVYCWNTVHASISNATATFNTPVTCGSNALSCGGIISILQVMGIPD